VGYVEYPVMGLTSGLAPLADLHSNATAQAFQTCALPGTGPGAVTYSGTLVRALYGGQGTGRVEGKSVKVADM
jgi:hypothetical protein